MKVLVLNGSPKAKSDTMELTNSFLSGMREGGESDIEVIDVIKKNIGPCLGCLGCWKNGDGKCVQQDDQNEILEKYAAADVIIWSFPLYVYSLPSHIKALLDRTIPLVKMNVVEVDGIVRHIPLVDFSKKKTIVISGCGFPDFDGNFDGLRLQCKMAFPGSTMICVPETPLMNVPGAVSVSEPKKAAFANAGKKFMAEKSLDEETIKALEAPMIPKKYYIKAMNGEH